MFKMDVFASFIFYILLCMVNVKVEASDSPLWCGIPPKCRCFPRMKMVHCTDSDKFPDFRESVRKTTKVVILASPKMCVFPEMLLKKLLYPSLKTINVVKTCNKCQSINFYKTQGIDLNIVSECSENQQKTTALNIVTGRPAAEATEAYGQYTGSTANFSDFWSTHDVTTKKDNVWVRNVNSWLNAGFILTGIIVIAAILIITIVIIKYRRQRTRCWSKMNNQRTGQSLRSIEDIGALSLASEESVELFSIPSTSTIKRRSLEREVRPKLS